MTGVRLLALVVAAVVLVGAAALLRRRRLRERYVVLWLAVGLGTVVLAAWPGLLDGVAGWLGIADPPNLLAFGGILFLLGVCAHLTLEVSRVEAAARRLAEEHAIMREEVESLRGQVAGPGSGRPIDLEAPDAGHPAARSVGRAGSS